MTDFEKFAGLRRPVPKWWVTVARDRDQPVSRGIVLLARREDGESKRYRVPISALCALARQDKLSRAEIEVIWRQVEDRYLAAARRRFTGETTGSAVLGVADI